MAEENSLPYQEPVTEEIDQSTYADEYSCMNELELELKLLEIEISTVIVKEQIEELKKERLSTQEEIKELTSTPLLIAKFLELIDENHCIIEAVGYTFYVPFLSTIDRELLKSSEYVCVSTLSNAVVEVLPAVSVSDVSILSHDKKPDITYNDIAGCEIEKREIHEAVEFPLTQPELFREIGIDPPNGVLLSGPPGTGKTMLAQAVAHHTNATLMYCSASAFVNSYSGEGPRMVREAFSVARQNAPAIIFIDEIDAIATARSDASNAGDREVQRILFELLNQIDGFDERAMIKVIMATNRVDTLDSALVRPGRVDHVIKFPLPDKQEKRLIFKTCTAKMSLSSEVDLEDYVSRPDKISPVEIAAICQEAGLLAIRENRSAILAKDFENGYKRMVKRPANEFEFYN